MNRFEWFYEKYMVLIGSVGHCLFIFQALKILETHSSHDVSLKGFVVSFVSLVSWLIYGFLKKDWVLIIVNLFGATASLICIIMIIMFQ